MVALNCDLLEIYQPIVLVNSGGYIPAVHGRSLFAGDSAKGEVDGSSSRRRALRRWEGTLGTSLTGPSV